jgi:UDP-N-acetylglucosamine:LPS N-acetylglucosamine transferase
MKKYCFAASMGGHLEEVACLKEIAKDGTSFLLTEKGGFQEISFCDKTRHVLQINRKEKTFIFKFIALFFESLAIFMQERPDCIISTGALATFPICVIAKLFGKKVIYIESFARVDAPSLTGKLMYHVADLFIVQWQEMLEFYPNAVYGGGIF